MGKLESGSELQKAIDKLLKKEPKWAAFDPTPIKGPKPGKTATGRPASSQAGAAGSFVESTYESREFWPAQSVMTTDGVFEFEWLPVKKMVGEGGVTIELKEPV